MVFCSELCNDSHFTQSKSQSPCNGLKGPPTSGTCYFSDIIPCTLPLPHSTSATLTSLILLEYTYIFLRRTFFFTWNALSLDIHMTNSMISFRSLLKCHLFNEIYSDHFIALHFLYYTVFYNLLQHAAAFT